MSWGVFVEEINALIRTFPSNYKKLTKIWEKSHLGGKLEYSHQILWFTVIILNGKYDLSKKRFHSDLTHGLDLPHSTVSRMAVGGLAVIFAEKPNDETG
jgi:hypothetical protein